MDWYFRHYIETPEVWIEQGGPEEVRTSWNRYFQFEHFHALTEIVSEHNRSDLKENAAAQGLEGYHGTPPIVPIFEIKVIREDERHRVETTYAGQTVEVSREHPWRMPKYLDHPVKDWASWREYKKRLDPDTPERWPKDWDAYVKETNERDAPTMLLLEGFFGVLREWTGLKRLLCLFYDDPRLVEDMMDQVLHLDLGIARRVVKDLRVDCVRFWEDMAFKNGPMISPAMFQKFMIPRYKEIIDFLHNHGIEILHVDSDGNINELLPLWMKMGVNFPYPLEVAAGMDAVALRKKYGRDIILSGGLDKRAFAKGRSAIREEVMAKVPFLTDTGGYFPGLDDSVPPNISLEDFRYFLNLLREIGGMGKLPE
jgi:uroporphyrinogen decarboxylase